MSVLLGYTNNGGRDSLFSCPLSAGHLVSVALEDVSCGGEINRVCEYGCKLI